MIEPQAAPASPNTSGPVAGLPPRRRSLSLSKRLAFGLVTAVGAYACIELISLCGLAWFYGGIANDTALRAAVNREDVPGRGMRTSPEILHPYQGYVRQPRTDADNRNLSAEARTSPWGFNDSRSPIQKRAPAKVILGVLGGSVGEEFANGSGQRLCDQLKRNPKFADKELVLVHLALQGYKQPQQLMTINYLLSQGAEFDLLLNIDGFNEVALPAVENVPHGVFASFPRSWHKRVAASDDPTVLRVIGRVAVRQDRSQAWARRISASPARFSATVNLLWRAYDRALWRGIVQDYQLLDKILPTHLGFAATGPPQMFPGPDDLYAECAGVWMRSSLQLHQLAAANGIRYYHFLQPNQYVPGSKEMGPEERTAAVHEQHFFRRHVERGYPWLRRFGVRLAEQGVRFHDLTQLFASQPLATYRDECCHYNERGYDMLADEIARMVLADSAVE